MIRTSASTTALPERERAVERAPSDSATRTAVVVEAARAARPPRAQTAPMPLSSPDALAPAGGVRARRGCRPRTASPPAARTARITARTTSGCVVTARSGSARESRLTLSSTRCSGRHERRHPPERGEGGVEAPTRRRRARRSSQREMLTVLMAPSLPHAVTPRRCGAARARAACC